MNTVEPTNGRKSLDLESIESSGYGPDEGDCGWFSFRPRWLQNYNTAGGFVCTQSMFLLAQGFLINGLFFVCLTTLERRFNLSSSQSGSIIAFYHLAYLLTSLFITFYANRAHRPLMLSIGCVILGAGCALFSLAHFTTGLYQYSSGRSNFCDPSNLDACEEDGEEVKDLSNYYYLFIVAMFINGVGCVPLYTCGFAVIEDSMPSGKSALYIGIANAVTILGPVIGYIVGGLLLSVYVDFDSGINPDDLDPSDPRWVGAWWVGFLMATVMCWVVAMPMGGFTKQIPGTAKQMSMRQSETHAKKGGQDVLGDSEFGKTLKDLPVAFKTMFKNPTFTCCCVAGATDAFAVAGFTAFLPKIIENQFHQTAGTAALLAGVIAVPGGIFGNIIAGVVVKKYDMRARAALKYCIFCCGIVTLMSPVALLFCGETQISGVNIQYNASASMDGVDDICNQNCKCDDEFYAPVCGSDNMVYYSACRAGCQGSHEEDGNTVYEDCSCIAGDTKTATSGICPESCDVMIPFLVIFFFIVMMNFMASTPSYLVTMRCVPDSQRTFAMGLHGFIYRFGSIPGPILFGVTIDSCCILWQQFCDDSRGSCWLYDSRQMAFDITLLGVCFKLTSTAIFSLALYLYVPPKNDGGENSDKKYGESSNGGLHKTGFSKKHSSETYFENKMAIEDDYL